MTRVHAASLAALCLLAGACANREATSPPLAADDLLVMHRMPTNFDGWTERSFSFTTLEAPDGGSISLVSGINAAGDIVGTVVDATGRHGFLLSGGVFTTIDFPGAAVTEARGIGPGGDIVGTYRLPGEPALNFHGFLRSADGEFRPVDYPGHTSTMTQRILPDGTMLGCFHDDDFTASMRGIVITRDGREAIDVFASMHNGATPDLRRIAGLYTNTVSNRVESYVIDDGVFRSFVVPGSLMTAAWDVSPSGEVAGIYRDAAGFHGFVLTAAGFVSVDVPGAALTRVRGINARGDVVGEFVAGGKTYGFLGRATHGHGR